MEGMSTKKPTVLFTTSKEDYQKINKIKAL